MDLHRNTTTANNPLEEQPQAQVSVTSTTTSSSSSGIHLGLQEALGIPELTIASQNLTEVANYIRETPKDRLKLQSSIRRLESEKIRVSKEMNERGKLSLYKITINSTFAELKQK